MIHIDHKGVINLELSDLVTLSGLLENGSISNERYSK